jgi:hypothetical protein
MVGGKTGRKGYRKSERKGDKKTEGGMRENVGKIIERQ